MHNIKWDTICSPQEDGGFGLKLAQLVNQAFMLKLGW